MPRRKAGDLGFSLPAHLGASAVCLALLTLIPIVLYGLVVGIGAGAGPPGNAEGRPPFALVPLVSFAFALLCTGLLSPLAMLLQLLRGQWRFPAWLPLAVAYPVAFALIACILIVHKARIQNPSELSEVATMSLIISSCFWAYWGPLLASETILAFLRRLRTRRDPLPERGRAGRRGT
jgi:hypothetical protein